jgi:chromosome segregation ATPase
MAFIKQRITKNGIISTALVEAYRKDGKPRQRLLANLYGAEDTLSALGRLAAKRERLRKERAKLEPDIEVAQRFYETITLNSLRGHQYTAEQRKEITPLLNSAKQLLKRVEDIDKELAKIHKEGAIIKKHCSAGADEIRSAALEYGKKLDEAEAARIALELVAEPMKAATRPR